MAVRDIVPIRSWNRIRNSGDALNAILVDKLLGAAPFQSSPSDPHLLGAGSILFMANSKSLIWGSGVLNRGAHLPSMLRSQVRALRGRKSADFMVEKGFTVGDIPFGDPGILAAELLSTTADPAVKRYRVAVVPHHDSMDHPFFLAARKRDDVCVIDILDDSLLPIQQISQSDVVVSQSLHGLIYAESLAKPSVWVSFRSDDIWCFKFEDWFTTTSNPQHKPISIDGDLEAITNLAELRYSKINKSELISAFPRELIGPNPQNFLDYESCRSFNPAFVFLDLKKSPHAPAGTSGSTIETQDSALLKSTLVANFRYWAEHPYTIVASAGSEGIPTRAQGYTISKALDARAGVEFAYVVPRYVTVPSHVHEIPLDNGVVLYKDLRVRSGVVCVRPTFTDITDNFIVAGV